MEGPSDSDLSGSPSNGAPGTPEWETPGGRPTPGPGVGTPSFDDTLSPPRWAFPPSTIPPRPAGKKRWPLVVGLVAVVLIVLAAVGAGLAATGIVSPDEQAEDKPATTPSQQPASPAPSPTPAQTPGATPSDAPRATPTGVPDLPVPGRTATPADPMPTVLPSNSDGGQIGQPID